MATVEELVQQYQTDPALQKEVADILADGKVLFDYTPSAADMVPEKRPEVVFYTHSHNDHYDAKAALELGIKRVYLGETWLERAKGDFQKASESTGKPVPEIIPLSLGQVIEQDGLKVTALDQICDSQSSFRTVDAVRDRDHHVLFDEHDPGRPLQHRARQQEDRGNDGGQVWAGQAPV